MNRYLIATLVAVAVAPFLLGTNLLQGAADCDVCCTQCGEEFCYPVPKEVTVSRHCWEIDLEKVCIPAVRYPWENWFGRGCGSCDDGSCDACCEPRCGRVRWVRVLRKVKYDCKRCTCEWVVRPVCDDCLQSLPADFDPHAAPEEEGDHPVPPDAAPASSPIDPPASVPVPLSRTEGDRGETINVGHLFGVE